LYAAVCRPTGGQYTCGNGRTAFVCFVARRYGIGNISHRRGGSVQRSVAGPSDWDLQFFLLSIAQSHGCIRYSDHERGSPDTDEMGPSRLLERISANSATFWGAVMKQLKDIKAQSIVEISLIAPLLLIALYIPADFGIGFFVAHLTQNAVREAARIGATRPQPFSASEAQVEAEAANRLPALLRSPTVNARLLTAGAADCMMIVEVSASGQYNFFLYQLLRLAGFSAPDNTPITRDAQMRYEFQSVTNSTPCT